MTSVDGTHSGDYERAARKLVAAMGAAVDWYNRLPEPTRLALNSTVTATELAQYMDVPVAEVYRRASRAGWRRSTGRPVRYALEDVIRNDGARRLATP